MALVDVHMPGMSGVEMTERVVRAKLATRIVVLTVVEDVRFPRRLLEVGALGYLTKGCSSEELVMPPCARSRSASGTWRQGSPSSWRWPRWTARTPRSTRSPVASWKSP